VGDCFVADLVAGGSFGLGGIVEVAGVDMMQVLMATVMQSACVVWSSW